MAPWWLRGSDDETYTPPEDDQARDLDDQPDDEPVQETKPATRGRPQKGGDQDHAPSRDGPPEEQGSGGDPPKKRKRKRKRKRIAPEIALESRPAPIPGPRVQAPSLLPSSPDLTTPSFSHPAVVPSGDERRIAMLCDLENLALGVRDSETKKLEIHLILERLLEKGKIIVKKAYADWERYSEFKRPCHEAAIELIDIPQKYYSGKNSADIKMVVDAMELCYAKEHLDTFAIISGDSDFSPLVSKLKENNKYVIGIGIRSSSSNLLIGNCDEFIFYEDVWRGAHSGPRLDHLSPKQTEVFGLMSDAMLALIRENKEVLWGSMLKQTMQRKRPSFNESAYGYGSFSDLLMDAERKGIIGLKRDDRSGGWVVTGFASH